MPMYWDRMPYKLTPFCRNGCRISLLSVYTVYYFVCEVTECLRRYKSTLVIVLAVVIFTGMFCETT